jgi:hypothetical protein
MELTDSRTCTCSSIAVCHNVFAPLEGSRTVVLACRVVLADNHMRHVVYCDGGGCPGGWVVNL